jgi:hypothetical protein
MPTGFWQVDVADVPEGERIESEGICWEMAWGELLRVVSDEPPEGAPTVAHLQLWGRGTHDNEEVLAGFSKRQGKKFVWKQDWYKPDGWYTKAAIGRKERLEEARKQREEQKRGVKREHDGQQGGEAAGKRAREDDEQQQQQLLLLQEWQAQELLLLQQDADEREHHEQQLELVHEQLLQQDADEREHHEQQLELVHEQLKYVREHEEAALQRQRVEREEAAQVALVARRLVLQDQLREVQAQLKDQLRAAASEQQRAVQAARDQQKQELKRPRQQLQKDQDQLRKDQDQLKVQWQKMEQQKQQMALEWQEHEQWKKQQNKEQKAAELKVQLKVQKAAEQLKELKEQKAAVLKEKLEQLKELKEQKATEQLHANKQLQKEAAEISKLKGQRQSIMAEMEEELQDKLAAELDEQKEQLKELKEKRQSIMAEMEEELQGKLAAELQEIKKQKAEVEVDADSKGLTLDELLQKKAAVVSEINTHCREHNEGKYDSVMKVELKKVYAEVRQLKRLLDGKASKYTGVTHKPCSPTHKWHVVIWHDGQNNWVGSYKDELTAACAYDEAARKAGKETNEMNRDQCAELLAADAREREAEEAARQDARGRRDYMRQYHGVYSKRALPVPDHTRLYHQMKDEELAHHEKGVVDEDANHSPPLTNEEWAALHKQQTSSKKNDGTVVCHLFALCFIVMMGKDGGREQDPSSEHNKCWGGKNINETLKETHQVILVWQLGIYKLTRAYIAIARVNKAFRFRGPQGETLDREEQLNVLKQLYLDCKNCVCQQVPEMTRIVNKYHLQSSASASSPSPPSAASSAASL